MKTLTDLGMLLLHALPMDRRMWENQLQIMPGRTVAPNLYDFGIQPLRQNPKFVVRDDPEVV